MHRQQPKHYTEVLQKIKEENPRVDLAKDKAVCLKSMQHEIILKDTECYMLNLIAFNIIDREGFYNLTKNESVATPSEWDENTVSNRKETTVYFFPSLHACACRATGAITLNHVVKYLKGAFNYAESGEFSVDTYKDRQYIERILDNEGITNLHVELSYSNASCSDGASKVIDDWMRASNTQVATFDLKGSSKDPLKVVKDGLIGALLNLSVINGFATATITNTETKKPEKVRTYEHPSITSVVMEDMGWPVSLYNSIRKAKQ